MLLKYKLVRLSSKKELNCYNNLYLKNGGDQSIPIDWMESSKVFGVFEDGKMVGGYVECCPPVRSTSDIPDQLREVLLKEECGSLENVQENAAFWIKRGVKTKGSLQAFVWATIVIRSVFFTKCRYTLGVSNRKSISSLYNFFCGKIIYTAGSKLIPGETYHVFLWSKTQLLTVGGKILLRRLQSKKPKHTEHKTLANDNNHTLKSA